MLVIISDFTGYVSFQGFGLGMWSVIISILVQDVQFRIGSDLILSCPYVKYFMDFNTKCRICSALAVLNL